MWFLAVVMDQSYATILLEGGGSLLLGWDFHNEKIIQPRNSADVNLLSEFRPDDPKHNVSCGVRRNCFRAFGKPRGCRISIEDEWVSGCFIFS